MKNFSRGKWCLGGHTGPAASEYQPRASPLNQTDRCSPSGLDFINVQGDYVVSDSLIAVMNDAN
jgi:hypothetical protein